MILKCPEHAFGLSSECNPFSQPGIQNLPLDMVSHYQCNKTKLGEFQQLTGGWIGGHVINGTTLIARAKQGYCR